MNDMRLVIVPKSDQLNSDDLISGPLTITITKVDIRPGTEQPVSIYFDGDNGKPYKCCKSMARVMVTCWGADANQYIGRSMTLYRDPKVQWGGLAVGGIRISHMSHIDAAHTMALTATKGSRKPFTVNPLIGRKEEPKKRTAEDLLLELRPTFDACHTEQEVDAIVHDERVVWATNNWKKGSPALNELTAMMAEAMERVKADDGSDADEPVPDDGDRP